MLKSLCRKPDLDLLFWKLSDHGQVAELGLCRVWKLTEGGLQEGRGVHGGTVGRDAAQRNHHLGGKKVSKQEQEIITSFDIQLTSSHRGTKS